jgi:hypothetical protein
MSTHNKSGIGYQFQFFQGRRPEAGCLGSACVLRLCPAAAQRAVSYMAATARILYAGLWLLSCSALEACTSSVQLIGAGQVSGMLNWLLTAVPVLEACACCCWSSVPRSFYWMLL